MDLEEIESELLRVENIIILLRQEVMNEIDRKRRIFELTEEYEKGEMPESTYLKKLQKI